MYWSNIKYKFAKTRNYINNVKNEINNKKRILSTYLESSAINVDDINLEQTVEILQSAQILAIPWFNPKKDIEKFTCISTTLAAQIVRTYSMLTYVSDMEILNKYKVLCDLEFATKYLTKILIIDETVCVFIITSFEFCIFFLI